jgi:hypothetical protein
MKKYLILAIGVLLFSCADDPAPGDESIDVCDTNRYIDSLFITSPSVETIKFGDAEDNQGNTKELFMDIYQPLNDDLEERPLMILAFGGAFVQGDRSEMEGFAKLFAKKRICRSGDRLSIAAKCQSLCHRLYSSDECYH